MAFVARSRSKAVEAEGLTRGSVHDRVNLRAVFGFTETRLDHDAQFYNNIQQNMKAFYKKLLEKLFGTP